MYSYVYMSSAQYNAITENIIHKLINHTQIPKPAAQDLYDRQHLGDSTELQTGTWSVVFAASLRLNKEMPNEPPEPSPATESSCLRSAFGGGWGTSTLNCWSPDVAIWWRQMGSVKHPVPIPANFHLVRLLRHPHLRLFASSQYWVLSLELRLNS